MILRALPPTVPRTCHNGRRVGREDHRTARAGSVKVLQTRAARAGGLFDGRFVWFCIDIVGAAWRAREVGDDEVQEVEIEEDPMRH